MRDVGTARRAKVVSIGCGAGFSGDRIDAPIPIVAHLATLPHPKVLILETLGERTIALAQMHRRREPDHGYEPLLQPLLRPVLGACLDAGIKIVSNLGAANPVGAGRAIRTLAAEVCSRPPRIGVVVGDDVTRALADIQLEVWEGDVAPWCLDLEKVVAANAYLGAAGIREALDAGADIVVTGRVADTALALGPLQHFFGWRDNDWDRTAAGLLAGHLLECGSQVSGGYFADPGMKNVPDMAGIGYPIAHVRCDGGIEITKPPATGGLVDCRTVKEQLLYEIHDPARYITPDGIVDLTNVSVAALGPDRVTVVGVKGHAATDSYKVTISVHGGWLGEGEISYAGPNAEPRARLAASTLRERLVRRGLTLRTRIDLIGVASVFDSDSGYLQAQSLGAAEDLRLRLAVEGERREDVESATQEVLALLCAGPAGGGGVRQRHTERLRTVSCLIPKSSAPHRLIWV